MADEEIKKPSKTEQDMAEFRKILADLGKSDPKESSPKAFEPLGDDDVVKLAKALADIKKQLAGQQEELVKTKKELAQERNAVPADVVNKEPVKK